MAHRAHLTSGVKNIEVTFINVLFNLPTWAVTVNSIAVAGGDEPLFPSD